jgi:hypothetical protein
MEFVGTVQKGQFQLPPVLNEARRLYLSGIKDGTQITETLIKESPNKSHKQIKTIFGLVVATVKQQCDEHGWDSSTLLKTSKPTGVPASEGLIKEYLYATCPIFDDDGQRITLSSPKCTMAKAAKFITEAMAIAASELSIYIPDPNPAWRDEKVEVSQ